ncbi:MAG: hypothetical protein ACRDBG_16525, partial [Waterburya sp.]
SEITYALEKYNLSINKAWPQCASWVLLKLAQSGDEMVGIISVKGSKVAEQFRLALQMKLKDPTLNPLIDGLGSFVDPTGKLQNPVYAGGISNSDILANTNNSDNNYIPNPIYQKDQLGNPRLGAFEV